MNHLEQLVAEWLQYRGYFVRTSILVGPRPRGGFEGELDVVALHPKRKHLLHIECSLDSNSKAVRATRFARKFACGQRFAKNAFSGFPVPDELEQVAILMLVGKNVREVGGVRVVHTRDLIHEINACLANTSPIGTAVPSSLPLLRTLQLAVDAAKRPAHGRTLLAPM